MQVRRLRFHGNSVPILSRRLSLSPVTLVLHLFLLRVRESFLIFTLFSWAFCSSLFPYSNFETLTKTHIFAYCSHSVSTPVPLASSNQVSGISSQHTGSSFFFVQTVLLCLVICGEADEDAHLLALHRLSPASFTLGLSGQIEPSCHGFLWMPSETGLDSVTSMPPHPTQVLFPAHLETVRNTWKPSTNILLRTGRPSTPTVICLIGEITGNMERAETIAKYYFRVPLGLGFIGCIILQFLEGGG